MGEGRAHGRWRPAFGKQHRGDFVERMRFFALAEQFERNSHGDHFSLNLNHANSESAAAFADPACDPAVKAAIHDHPLPHQGGPIKIKLEGTNRDLRNLIKSHGFEPSEAKFNDDRLKDDGFAFHSGRRANHFAGVRTSEEFTRARAKCWRASSMDGQFELHVGRSRSRARSA